MSPANQMIEKVVREGLRPHLLAAGFNGKVRTYVRAFPYVTQVVAVQASTRGTGEFVVEVGLSIPVVEGIMGSVLTHVMLNKQPVTWSFRLPRHAADTGDPWWEVGEPTELPDLAARLAKAWHASGQPFTESSCDLPSCMAALANAGAHLPACAAAVALQDRVVAKQQLSSALAFVRPRNERFAGMIEEWAANHGVLPV